MGLFGKGSKIKETEVLPEEAPVVTLGNGQFGLNYFVDLVKQIRPQPINDYKQSDLKFKALFYKLQSDKKALYNLKKALYYQFLNSNFVPALTESGIVGSRGFLQELVSKLKHKFLPPLLERNDFLYVINQVFYRHKDHCWIQNLDKQLWIDLFKVLGIEINITDSKILQQLNQSLHIIAQRTVTLGLERDVMKGVKEASYESYPFFQLDRAVQSYLQLFYNEAPHEEIVPALQKINEAVIACRKTIEDIGEHRRANGTSLAQTFMLYRIDQYLERIMLITDMLDHNRHFSTEKFIDYFIRIVSNEKTKNSLRRFVSANVAFLAFKITEHGGSRGEKYITATRADFWWMVKSAMGGGFIVSITAFMKNMITKLPLPPFWQAFAYSTNYAYGFQAMHETHTTLATKQPAFTASALAGNLDYYKENRKPDMYGLAITIARTSRSQLASFAGNLIIVFPMSYSIAAFYHFVTGSPILNREQAVHMLMEQHPYFSLSLLYACFTGVFLFLSGVIAGYVENGINYGRVGLRLKHHPLFKNTLSPKRLEAVTGYVVHNAGPLMGNIALGFFLGMAGFLGHIFGLPFDIRHITIASGNSAIAFYTTGTSVGVPFLMTVLGGVLLIGLFNFLVSFALAFFVAIKSRGVRLKDYPELITVVGKFFIKYPIDFIYPPKYPREIDEVKRKFRLSKHKAIK